MTLAAIDLKQPAILFTFSNSTSIALKCSADPGHYSSIGVGYGAIVMLFAFALKGGSF